LPIRVEFRSGQLPGSGVRMLLATSDRLGSFPLT